MSDRAINCSGCGKYLGEIRDARLRKDIVFLCDDCETKRKAAASFLRGENSKPKSPVDDLFDILGGRWKSLAG